MNSNSYTVETIYSQVKPPQQAPGKTCPTILHVMSRLDEKQSAILALDIAWGSGDFSDADRRNMIRDVRRALIDAIEDLSHCGESPH